MQTAKNTQTLKPMQSGRALSRMTKTTAASVNATTKFDKYRKVSGIPQSMHAQSEKPQPRAKAKTTRAARGAMSAITALTKPETKGYTTKPKQLANAGEILSYPYSFDQDGLGDEAAHALDKRLAKIKYEDQYRVAEIQNQ